MHTAVAGYMGMRVAVEANVRTATAAEQSLESALEFPLCRLGAGLSDGWLGSDWHECNFLV